MSANFMSFLNINTNLIPAPVTGNTSKQVCLVGQRKTNGELYLATNGFPQPNYYVPFLLPSFSNGTSALTYLSYYGIQSQLGYNFTLSLPQPTSVSSSFGNTVVIWSTVPSGFNALVGFALSGTLSQGSVNGTVLNATTSGGQAYLTVSGTVAFTNSGGVMILSGVNNIQYPDPNNSDPIALMTWDFYQTALSANVSATGVPAAYLSILSDRDVSISPVSTPIALIAPTTVTVNSNGSVTLTYSYTGGISTLANFGYLPTTALGNTTVTQATSLATGVFDGYAITQLTSTTGTVAITVINVSGTFNTTNNISVVLDSTYNMYNYLDGINLYASVLQFPINSLTNITTTYADFYNGNTVLNQANQVLNNHYGTYAIAGNITSLPAVAGTLPVANDQTKILVTYPYFAAFGDIPYDNTAGTVGSGRVASAVAYMLANGDYTQGYPALTQATIDHLPVSSLATTTSYSGAVNGSGNAAVTQGWLPLAPNSANVVTFLQSNTTLTTIPNTNIQDTEFRFTHIWDCVRYIKQQVAVLYQQISVLPNNQGTVNISPTFLEQFRNGILAILYTAQNNGIVKNVALYENLVVVIQDPTNANQVDATVPSQMISQLIGANVNINVFSGLYQFNNTAPII